MTCKILKLTLALMFCGGITSGCQIKEEMDTMRESTEAIEKNAAGLGHDMREVEASNSRTAGLLMMNQATGDAGRFAGATKFVTAMEFQKWHGDKHDTIEIRLLFFERAIKVLFAATKDWMNYGLPLNWTDDPGYFLAEAYSADFRKLGAIAAELGFIHPEQELRAGKANVSTVSLYDLLVSGLNYEKNAARGEAIPNYAVEVLKWKPFAIYYLQLRHNFLLGKTLGQLTPYSDNFLQKVLMTTSATRWMVTSHVNLDQLSQFQFEEAKHNLDAVEKTKKDLIALGHKPVYNTMILRAWNSLTYSSQDTKRLNAFGKAKKLSLQGYLAN